MAAGDSPRRAPLLTDAPAHRRIDLPCGHPPNAVEAIVESPIDVFLVIVIEGQRGVNLGQRQVRVLEVNFLRASNLAPYDPAPPRSVSSIQATPASSSRIWAVSVEVMVDVSGRARDRYAVISRLGRPWQIIRAKCQPLATHLLCDLRDLLFKPSSVASQVEPTAAAGDGSL